MIDDEATNPEAVEEEAVPEEVADDADDTEAEEAEGEDEETSEADDDTDEVEVDGVKYRVPKALKGAFMMNADYTRKTQEVADQRKALEEQQQKFRQQAEAHQQSLRDHAKLVSLDEQLEQFGKVNWNALEADDPLRAQSLWRQYQQVKDARQNLAGELAHREQQRALETQRERAKRLEEGQEVLRREIKGWGPDLAREVSEFGMSMGLTKAEVASLDDPRAVKILHAAMVGHKILSKQMAQAKKPAAPDAKPVPKVGKGTAPTVKNPERMSTDEWMRHRQDQLRKRG